MESAARSTDHRDWRGFARLFGIAVATLSAGYLALALVVDPYDTGRSTLLSRGAVRPQGPRTASAVRGRDPAYAGAILGNSHIQLIEPSALSRLTGVPFVQLSVAATGPGEQFAILGWYLRHHPAPRALVLSADAYWCGDDPGFSSEHAFPYWLLADPAAYLRGLVRFSAAQETINRIGWLLNPRRKVAARDGWWDYEANYLGLGYGREQRFRDALDRPVPEAPEPHKAGPFPAAARFRAELARIPEATALVLVFPPIYAGGEPRPGTARAAAEAACRAAIRDALPAHRLSALVDWRGGRPESRDPDLFFDQNHYRLPLAGALTQAIAAEVVRLTAGPEAR